eukprot:983852-Pleurochrysis_carterae.AAC.1
MHELSTAVANTCTRLYSECGWGEVKDRSKNPLKEWWQNRPGPRGPYQLLGCAAIVLRSDDLNRSQTNGLNRLQSVFEPR